MKWQRWHSVLPVMRMIELAGEALRDNAKLAARPRFSPIEFSITPYLPFPAPGAITRVKHLGDGLLHYTQPDQNWEGYYW